MMKEKEYFDKANQVSLGHIYDSADTTIDEEKIVGELLISQELLGSKKVRLENNKEIYVFLPKTFNGKKYKTIGYVKCGEQAYVALKKEKKRWFLFLIPLLLFLLLLLGGFYFLQQENIGIDPNAKDYDYALKRPENMGDSEILVPAYSKFTVKKGTSVIDTVLFNPEDNPCFFKFTLVDKESNDVLYESQLVPPGKGIVSIETNRPFTAAGEQKAVLKFKTVDLKDKKTEYNGSEFEVTISVVE